MALDPELIAQWKEEYGRVYTVDHRGVDYAFRELKLSEYTTAMVLGESSVDFEDSVVKSALLSHRDGINKIPAGFVSVLSDEIIEYSGFGNPKISRRVLNIERKSVENLLDQMKAFVLAAMPSYKEEDLDGLSFRGLCHKVVLAEEIIYINQRSFTGDMPQTVFFDIDDPEEVAARQAAEEEEKRKRQQRAWELLGKSGGSIPDDDDKGPPLAPEVKAEDPIAAKLREALGG